MEASGINKMPPGLAGQMDETGPSKKAQGLVFKAEVSEAVIAETDPELVVKAVSMRGKSVDEVADLAATAIGDGRPAEESAKNLAVVKQLAGVSDADGVELVTKAFDKAGIDEAEREEVTGALPLVRGWATYAVADVLRELDPDGEAEVTAQAVAAIIAPLWLDSEDRSFVLDQAFALVPGYPTAAKQMALALLDSGSVEVDFSVLGQMLLDVGAELSTIPKVTVPGQIFDALSRSYGLLDGFGGSFRRAQTAEGGNDATTGPDPGRSRDQSA